MAGIFRMFDGVKYIIDHWYATKREAQKQAKKLRAKGGSARVIAGSSHYKPHFGSMGWIVYRK